MLCVGGQTTCLPYTWDRACIVADLRELSAFKIYRYAQRITMVYLTVGYRSALQYIYKYAQLLGQPDGRRPREASLTHSCVTAAMQLTSAEVNLLTRSFFTNRSAACLTRGCPYMTSRSKAYLAHL